MIPKKETVINVKSATKGIRSLHIILYLVVKVVRTVLRILLLFALRVIQIFIAVMMMVLYFLSIAYVSLISKE